MSEIELDASQKTQVVDKLKKYFDENFEMDIGQFEAEFLLDFFAEHVGPYFYNQGVRDANTLIEDKMNDLQFDISDLEKLEP